MDSVRVDLNLLQELRDSGKLNQDDQKFVLEMMQRFADGKQLSRTEILRVVDLCTGQQ
jgi:hypothetical protein